MKNKFIAFPPILLYFFAKKYLPKTKNKILKKGFIVTGKVNIKNKKI